jgi:cytochrome c oxidase assembly protein subunit 15
VKRSILTNTELVNNKSVAYWMFGMSGLVAGMVTIGGITRLTRSGLSMTNWKLQGNTLSLYIFNFRIYNN